MSRKTCTKCGKTKPATPDFFSRTARGPTGLLPRCKTCMKAYQQAIYAANPALRRKAAERAAAWTKKNGRKPFKDLPAKAKQLRYAATRRWETKNPTVRPQVEKRWRDNNPHKVKAKIHRQRARKVNAVGAFTARDVALKLKRQKNRCYWCKVPLGHYHVDHVVPLVLGGTNFPANIVCACAPCNLRKGGLPPEEFKALLKKDKKNAVL